MQSQLDLNLLVALDALLSEGSVTGAAERLHLSAPAMSRTLGRIRRALGDPVLTRAGRGLVPTPRALAIQPRVRVLVEEAQSLLADSDREPAVMERTFAIRANDGIVGEIGAPLVARTRAEAPGVRLRFLPEGREDAAALREGVIDLDIGAMSETAPEIHRERLLSERAVGVVRATHPLAAGPVTMERFAAGGHLSVSRRGRLTGPIDELLAERGLSRTVVASTATFCSAVFMLLDSDVVGLLPERFARRVAPVMGLHVFEVPLDLPTLTVEMAWHPRHDADAAHAWLRGCVRDVVRAEPSVA